MAAVKVNKFEYGSDSATLGFRWTDRVEMFDLAVVANGMEDQNIIKATFLSQVGLEVYQIIKANLDLENEETTLEVIKTRLEEVLVTPRSEYTEICAFRRAVKERDETVNEYAIRLRKLALQFRRHDGERAGAPVRGELWHAGGGTRVCED